MRSRALTLLDHPALWLTTTNPVINATKTTSHRPPGHASARRLGHPRRLARVVTGNALLRVLGLCVLAGLLVAGIMFPAVGGLGIASNQASETVNSVSSNLVQSQVPMVTT